MIANHFFSSTARIFIDRGAYLGDYSFVVCLVKYKGMTLEEAAQTVVLHKLKKMGGRGGLIAIDTKGNITMPFNTKGMYRAYKKNNEDEYIGIYKK